MRYVCSVAFCVDMYDNDGFSTGEYLMVEVGDEYETDDSEFRLLGGQVRLECENGNWLELPQEYVDSFFTAKETDE